MRKKKYDFLSDLAQLERDIKSGKICGYCGKSKTSVCSCRQKRNHSHGKSSKQIRKKKEASLGSHQAETIPIQSKVEIPGSSVRLVEKIDVSSTQPEVIEIKLPEKIDPEFLRKIDVSDVEMPGSCKRCRVYDKEDESDHCLYCIACLKHQNLDQGVNNGRRLSEDE